MWDEQQDKEMMRNQMVAIIVMSLLLFGWFYFFAPQPAPPPEQPAAAPGQQAPEPAQPAPAAIDGPVALPESAPASGWPHLPPPASDYDPETDDIVLADDLLRLTFTRIGGRLKSAQVLLEPQHGGTTELLPRWVGPDPTTSIYPLGLRFTDPAIGDALDYRRWDATVAPGGDAVTFELTLPDAATIRKTFALNGRPNVLTAEVQYVNHEAQPRRLGLDVTPAYSLNWGPGIADDASEAGFSKSFVWHKNEATEVLHTSELADSVVDEAGRRLPGVDWLGLRDKYFLIAMKSDANLPDGWLIGDADQSRFGLSAQRFELAPGERHVARASVYMGPMHIGSLGAAWPDLPEALRFFDSFDIMDSFAKLLLRMLNWIHDNLIASYGIAIIILTVIVRLLMMPLNIRMVANGKAMKELQPEIEQLREECGDDQQELGRRMMELYRDRGINPLSGCFPMLLQMPIFIALYRMLWQAFELRGASFLWIDDLSQPDALFRMPFMEAVPFVGHALANFNLLPVLGAVAMVISMRIMPTGGPAQNPQQKMMMNIMPVVFSVFVYNFSSGLNLYVLTSTLLGIGQQYVLNPLVKAPKPKPRVDKPGKKKKKDFYTRALERQKEMEKAAKEAKKRKKARR